MSENTTNLIGYFLVFIVAMTLLLSLSYCGYQSMVTGYSLNNAYNIQVNCQNNGGAWDSYRSTCLWSKSPKPTTP